MNWQIKASNVNNGGKQRYIKLNPEKKETAKNTSVIKCRFFDKHQGRGDYEEKKKAKHLSTQFREILKLLIFIL